VALKGKLSKRVTDESVCGSALVLHHLKITKIQYNIILVCSVSIERTSLTRWL